MLSVPERGEPSAHRVCALSRSRESMVDMKADSAAPDRCDFDGWLIVVTNRQRHETGAEKLSVCHARVAGTVMLFRLARR